MTQQDDGLSPAPYSQGHCFLTGPLRDGKGSLNLLKPQGSKLIRKAVASRVLGDCVQSLLCP